MFAPQHGFHTAPDVPGIADCHFQIGVLGKQALPFSGQLGGLDVYKRQNYISGIYTKLGVHNRVQIMNLAAEYGYKSTPQLPEGG